MSIKLVSVLLIVVGLLACQSPGEIKMMQAGCNSEQLPADEPVWVKENSNTEGYYVGVGAANVSSDKDALVFAREEAKAILADSIKTKIKKNSTFKQRVERINGKEFTQEESERFIQSITEISLENVRTTNRWLNKNSCTWWVKVVLDDKSVEYAKNKKTNELRILKAEKQYCNAKDINRSLSDRIDDIEIAINTISRTDFSYLPLNDLNDFKHRYMRLQDYLRKQSESRHTMLVISATQSVDRDFVHKLSNHFLTSMPKTLFYKDVTCSVTTDCLDKARDEQGKFLLLVKVDTFKNEGVFGSVIGNIVMDVEFYKIGSDEKIGQARGIREQVTSFNVSDFDWGVAIDKAFQNSAYIAMLDDVAPLKKERERNGPLFFSQHNVDNGVAVIHDVKPNLIYDKPGMVLLPIQSANYGGESMDIFRSNLQEGLSYRYKVFSGENVYKFLKRQEKQTCTAEQCLQELANRFHVKLVGRGVISPDNKNYLVTIEVRNVLEKKNIESNMTTCQRCDLHNLAEHLRAKGRLPKDDGFPIGW